MITDRPIVIKVDTDRGEVAVSVVRHKPAYTHCRVPSSRANREPYNVVIPAEGDPRCGCDGSLFRGRCFHGQTALTAVSGS